MTKNLMELQCDIPTYKVEKGLWVRYESYGSAELGRVLRQAASNLQKESFKLTGSPEKPNATVFVVFNCAGKWDEFENYTAAGCSPQELFPINPLDLNEKGIPRLVARNGDTKFNRLDRNSAHDVLDDNEINLLLYLEDRAVNDFGVISMQRVSGDFEATLSMWSQTGFLDYGDLKSEHLSPQNPEYRRWVKLSPAAHMLAARERRRCAEEKFLMWRERFKGSEACHGG